MRTEGVFMAFWSRRRREALMRLAFQAVNKPKIKRIGRKTSFFALTCARIALSLQSLKHACKTAKKTTTYREASLMLCFWLSETSTNDRPVKNKCGGGCYGCSIYSRSVLRAYYAFTHTFRVHIYLTGVGIQTLFVHWSGCGRPQIAGRAEEGTPLFVCCLPTS